MCGYLDSSYGDGRMDVGRELHNKSVSMLGLTTICATPHYTIKGALLRPDLLSLQIWSQLYGPHTSCCIDMDDQYIQDLFKGAISGVKELYNDMVCG